MAEPKAEPVRKLAEPKVGADGKMTGKSSLTPEAMKTRGAIPVPSQKVIPVIMVPGIMGTNLRANTRRTDKQNQELAPGEPAWAPPNGTSAGLNEATIWKSRNPAQRQRILDGETVEVDPRGKIEIPDDDSAGSTARAMRRRWWGELHWDSYGDLLVDLHLNLNQTFKKSIFGNRIPNSHWEDIIEFDKARWDAADMPALTEPQLEKFSQFQYPVYACGYNWIQSNELSAERLKSRIQAVIKFWTDRKFDCKQVILVTHSMGGLVARACAKQIPHQILGIVHGVMPALGAPLAYRRITCGTETSAPGKGPIDRLGMEKFADIAGNTTERTTPVMATACGALELLPNHLYPSPWLFASVRQPDGEIKDLTSLSTSNPYDLYRGTKAWFRLINPALADPAGKYDDHDGGVEEAIQKAVSQAERFHMKLLDTYYHPNTYAYYGADADEMSFGTFRWITDNEYARTAQCGPIIPIGVPSETPTWAGGARAIRFPAYSVAKEEGLLFSPSEQDTPGDGTVSQQSGMGPQGRVKRIFRTTGYNHQGSYKNESMLKLTHHLIVLIVQVAS